MEKKEDIFPVPVESGRGPNNKWTRNIELRSKCRVGGMFWQAEIMNGKMETHIKTKLAFSFSVFVLAMHSVFCCPSDLNDMDCYCPNK